MSDEDPQSVRSVQPAEQARKLAEAGEYAGAQAWALVGIADELKAIRREQYRQARGSRG
jgi:hypothetical protein